MLKRDAIVLMAVCGFAVLCAGGLGVGGNRVAHLKMCTANLYRIGRAYGIYSDTYDGKLPLVQYYERSVPSIESTYLVTRRSSSGTYYIQMGCVYGAGLVDGQTLFCPLVSGWLGDKTTIGQNNGTYMGAINPATAKFADLLANVNQGVKVTKGYCYWPLNRKSATAVDLSGMGSNASTRYKLGLPYSATVASDLDMTRPIITDNKFHYRGPGDWMVNCVYPDGHVKYQHQPRAVGVNGYGVTGTWGMYSADENCQLPSGFYTYTSPVTVSDETEKNYQLATAVTPTEFACGLQQE
jgi:hypothetical protein